MSKKELGRVEVLSRVRSRQLRVVDAGRLMRVGYRQAKRLWQRYREEGAAGLKHRSAGRPSNRAYEPKFRQKVLRLVREKYGGPVGERFGPTLAAEHLVSEDGLSVDAETLRRWDAGSRTLEPGAGDIGGGASARSTLERWCKWTAAFTRGWRSAGRRAA